MRLVKIPLSLGVTGVIAYGCGRVHAELSHESSANIVVVKIASEAKLLELNFVGTEQFARSTHRIIDWLVEVVVVGNVRTNLRRKELGVERHVLVTRVAV